MTTTTRKRSVSCDSSRVTEQSLPIATFTDNIVELDEAFLLGLSFSDTRRSVSLDDSLAIARS